MYENLKRENNNDVCQIYNVLSFDLKNSLWKRKFNFDKTQKVLKAVNDFVNANKDSVSNLKYNRYKGFVQKKTDPSAAAEGEKEKNDNEQQVEPLNENQAELKTEQVNPTQNGKKVGLVTDEDLIKLRPSEKKKIDWKNKTYLAPLTTVCLFCFLINQLLFETKYPLKGW
jgi:tRNA-dihydrouridine synthase 3